MTINIGIVQPITVTLSTFTFFNQAVWGNISGSITNQTDLQNALTAKVNKTGDTIEGTFTNSEAVTQIILAGNNSGDGSQGQPLSNSSPRIDLGTYQVSEYRSGEAQKGGYSELLRLRSLDPKAKPTIAWYSDDNKPKSWIVTHYQPQDLQIYANLASFPVTGVNDGLRAYYAQDTSLYYTWNGSAYIPLLPNNPEYYYRAIHQHISLETSDTTGYSLFTRLGIPYDLDVVPITTANSHLVVSSGDNNGKPFGAFILQGGKTFSSQPIIFYPNSSNAGTVEAWKDSATDNIFTNNTEGLRMRVLADGNSDNIVSGQRMLALNTEGLNWLGINENVVIGGASQYGLGINRSAGVALDVQRRDLGVANNTEYTIARFTRTDADGFLNVGYIGNGTGIGSYQVRTTNSKDFVFGVTGATTALRIAATTGNVTLSGAVTASNLSGTNTGDETNASIIGRVLTGLSTATKTIVSAGDTILQAFGKLQGQMYQLQNTWQPRNYGFISWSYDPAVANAFTVLPVAGQGNVVNLIITEATTITNINLWISTIGVSLNNCFVALYQNGSLLAQSADQSANWQIQGNKTIALSSPQAVTAGTVDVVFWANGGTLPAFQRSASSGIMTFNQGGATLRYATAGSGLTSTAPASITKAQAFTGWWVAVS
jgi:hypothetical protein